MTIPLLIVLIVDLSYRFLCLTAISNDIIESMS